MHTTAQATYWTPQMTFRLKSRAVAVGLVLEYLTSESVEPTLELFNRVLRLPPVPSTAEGFEARPRSLRMDEYRDRLLAIRRGEMACDEVERWRLALHRELGGALESTSLSKQPDYARTNELLLRARRMAASPEYAT